MVSLGLCINPDPSPAAARSTSSVSYPNLQTESYPTSWSWKSTKETSTFHIKIGVWKGCTRSSYWYSLPSMIPNRKIVPCIFNRKGIYFSTPDKGRKIFFLPSNKPSQWKMPQLSQWEGVLSPWTLNFLQGTYLFLFATKCLKGRKCWLSQP